VREARGAADAREGDDVFLRKLDALQHFVECGEHGKIAAPGAPRGVIGGEVFLGDFLRGWGGGRRGGGFCDAHFMTPWRISLTRKVRPSVLVKLRIFGSQYRAR